MKYQILSSGSTPSSIEAIMFLESHIQKALDAGGQLVGGVSVTFGSSRSDTENACYNAFQAVLMPTE